MMEPKRMAGDGDHLLPPEIWREVLTRAPAETIFRCRFVCKSWYSLVSSPNFISDHSIRNQNNKSRCRVLLQLRGEEDVGSFSSHDDSFTESREHDDVPQKFLGPNVEIVGSCNGLICLAKYECYDDLCVIRFLIWNPTIRKLVEVRSRPFCSMQTPYYFGFGFDSKTGDYKVLFLLSDEYDFDDYAYEIFDLRKGVWRDISLVVHSYSWDDVQGPNPECYLNGAVHWSGYTYSRRVGPILLAFDMSDELFREIRMPNCAEFTNDDGYGGGYHIATRIVTFDGLIHVIVFKADQYGYVDMSRSYSIWAMKEYGVTESWTKMFSIDLQNTLVLPDTRLCLNNFHSWDNGEVLMVHDLPVEDDAVVCGKHGLVSYNTRSRKCKCVFSSNKYISNLCRYEESLALM